MRADAIRTEIDIGAPLGAVWRILTDYPAYGAWNPYLVSVVGKAEAGARLRVTADPGGGAPPLEQEVPVTACSAPVMRWEGGLPDRTLFHGDHWFVLTQAPGGCRFSHFELFTGRLAGAILAEHGDRIAANFERFNQALKRRAEGEAG